MSRTPKNLGPDGRALWVQITEGYELNPPELRILEDACRQTDMCAKLAAAFAEDGRMTVKGSMGQEVVHPLISELRMYRATTAQLLARIKLPADDAKPQRAHGEQQREAIMARWAQPLRAVEG